MYRYMIVLLMFVLCALGCQNSPGNATNYSPGKLGAFVPPPPGTFGPTTQISNPFDSPVALPRPFNGVIPRGGSVVVGFDPLTTQQMMGGNTGGLVLSSLPTTTTTPGIGPIVSLTYGSGEDGVSVFDGVNTFAFASLSGSTYTLLRDVFLAGGSSVASTVTIQTSGYRVFCNGMLTNTGTIAADGNSVDAGTGAAASASGTIGVGSAGGAGHADSGAGAAGSVVVGTLATVTGSQMVGGAGGAGNDAGIDGGAPGAYTLDAGTGGGSFIVTMTTGDLFGQTGGLVAISGGTGGGGGGSASAGATGGGGGGGGGVLDLVVFAMVNNGTLRAAGGVGGNATGTGNAGGGGGGGGGMILLTTAFFFGSGTVSVPGGDGGAAVGTGFSGSTGNVGHVANLAN